MSKSPLLWLLVGVAAGVCLYSWQRRKPATAVGLAGHFPMPEFMMPTYFEQETRLLDPNRG